MQNFYRLLPPTAEKSAVTKALTGLFFSFGLENSVMYLFVLKVLVVLF